MNMIAPRLTSKFQISALIRSANEYGDEAMVIRKGDDTSGEIFILALIRGATPRFFAKVPCFDKGPNIISIWQERKLEDIDNKQFFKEYIEKLIRRDPDLWLIELNVSDEQRLVGLLGL